MTGFDKERMERLVGSMRDSLRLLGELGALPEADFMGDEHKQASAKYNFVAAIEAVIDVSNHLIATQKLRPPKDYADTFAVLADAGVVDAGFASELQKMARFRNRLVHRYWDVAPDELWRILKTRVDDFEGYVRCVGAYLEARGQPDST